MVKLRIISDLHYDTGINRELFNEKFKKSKDTITLIAGDLASSVELSQEFLEKYFKNQQVIFIGGNHMVYQKGMKTIYEINEDYKKAFPITHAYWKYLSNDWIWIPGTDNQVAIIGSIFFTDYEYSNWTSESFNEQQRTWNIRENQLIAQGSLNDFVWGYEAPGQHLTPYTYRELHLEAKKEVLKCYKEIIKQNPDAKVILMTHHCLSSKCIDDEYINSRSNVSYVSELENWLCEEMPNLRLVISGHVHCRKDFTFGKDNKRYVINAFGYIPHNEPAKKIPFNANFIIRTNKL